MERETSAPHGRASHNRSSTGTWLRRICEAKRSQYPTLGLAAGCVLVIVLMAYSYLPAAYHLQAGGRAFVRAQDGQPDQLDRAIRHFQRAVEAAPEDGYAHRRLGQAWLLAGNNEAARDALLQAADLRPHHLLIWIELGRAYDGLGQVGEALAAYERGGYGPAWEAAMVNYIKIADWQIGAGADGEARATLARVLDIDADSLPALYRLLGIEQRAGSDDAAALRARLAMMPAQELTWPEEPRLQDYARAAVQGLVEEGIWSQDAADHYVSRLHAPETE